MQKRRLIWNTYLNDINHQNIKIYNIFDNTRFQDGLRRIKLEYKKAAKEYKDRKGFEHIEAGDKWLASYKNEIFKESVRRALSYSFWSKCEYEVIVTSWPSYITREELDRLSDTKDQYKYCACVNLETQCKIDVYQQVMLNFDIFIEYLWANLDLITITKRK